MQQTILLLMVVVFQTMLHGTAISLQHFSARNSPTQVQSQNESRQKVEQFTKYMTEGYHHAHAERFHASINSFNIALKYMPDASYVLSQQAYCYFRVGKYKEAERTYQKAIKSATALGQQLPLDHYYLSLVLSAQGKRDKAIVEVQRSLAIHDSPYAARLLEALRSRKPLSLEKYDLARIYKKSYKQKPKN